MSDFLFHFDDDVVGVKRERAEQYGPNKRMRVKLEKTTKPKKTKRTTRGRSQKTSQYKNIFWGSQQEAWMGSVRFKGVIVRSCSRRSDLLAARILNTRCRQKGLTPPNPEVGFLTETELRTHTQVAKRGRKKKTDSVGPMSKVKKNQMTSRPNKKSRFKNIFWGTQQQAWMGNIRVKGTIVRSCSRASDVQAAKILNSRCREKGITPPNPEVGFLDNTNVKQEKTKNVRGRYEPPSLPVSGQLVVSERDCNLENYDPLGSSTLTRKRNEDCFLAQLKLAQKELERCLYNNVFYSHFDSCWVGRVQHLEVKASTPELAAKLLNTKCRKERFPIPNPSAGYLTDVEYAVLTSTLSTAVLSPRQGNVFVKTEPDLLAHDLPPVLNDNFSKTTFDDLVDGSLPSVILTEEDEFSSMNNLMLDLIENKLLPNSTSGLDSSDGFFGKLGFDDLPYPNF